MCCWSLNSCLIRRNCSVTSSVRTSLRDDTLLANRVERRKTAAPNSSSIRSRSWVSSSKIRRDIHPPWFGRKPGFPVLPDVQTPKLDGQVLKKVAHSHQIRHLRHYLRAPKKADPSDTTVTVGQGSHAACLLHMCGNHAKLLSTPWDHLSKSASQKNCVFLPSSQRLIS